MYTDIPSEKRLVWHKHFLGVLLVGLVCAATAYASSRLDMGDNDIINKENILMLFLIGVLLATIVTKNYYCGFFAALINLFYFNYYFAFPSESFSMLHVEDMMLAALFLLVTLLCCVMAGKFQHQVQVAQQSEQIARLLCEVSDSFLNTVGFRGITEKGMQCIHQNTGYPCCVVLHGLECDKDGDRFQTEDFPESRRRDRDYVLPIEGRMGQLGTLILANVTFPVRREKDMLIRSIVPHMALALDREAGYNERERHALSAESERLKSALLRGISHDLRTPLTEIMGASSFLIDHAALEADSVRSLASDIYEASSWLIMTVQNILNLTRINDERFDLKKQFESVDDLINQTTLHAPKLAKEGRLKVSVPEEIIILEANGPLLVQALVNLLDNAYRHAGSGCSVELAARRKGKTVVLTVSDDGIGIDPAILNRLFEEFSTSPRSSMENGFGMGLGLSICKAIVLAHGGTICAANRTQGGAIFTVTLPCEEVTDE